MAVQVVIRRRWQEVRRFRIGRSSREPVVRFRHFVRMGRTEGPWVWLSPLGLERSDCSRCERLMKRLLEDEEDTLAEEEEEEE
jgi:hypothetical protein